MCILRRFAGILLLPAAFLPAQDSVRSLTILHTNDLHARLLPDDQGRGGFAALAAAIRREREGCDSCLLLNAGDLVQGTPVSTLFHGLPVYEIANRPASTRPHWGTTKFDYGYEQAGRFIRAARYPIVTANVVDNGGRLPAHPYLVLNVNGVQVAVIGAVLGNLHQ